MDYVSNSSEIDTSLMQKFYDETNQSLSEAKNEVGRAFAAETAMTQQETLLIPLAPTILRTTAPKHEDQPQACKIVAGSKGVRLAE